MTRLVEIINQPIENSIAVDAACFGNPGPVEYKGVFVRTKTIVFQQGPYEGGTNNIGEFLAIVHALAYCKKHNYTFPIYSDSQTALAWVKRKEVNTTMQRTEKNARLFDILQRAEAWLKANTYKNKVLKWETSTWGEVPADFGRKE